MSDRARRERIALRGARDEAMRRARNAAFYAGASSVTERAREAWRGVVSDMAREAREHNRALLRVRP